MDSSQLDFRGDLTFSFADGQAVTVSSYITAGPGDRTAVGTIELAGEPRGTGTWAFVPYDPFHCPGDRPASNEFTGRIVVSRSHVFTIAGSATGTVGAGYSTVRNITFDTVSGAHGTLLTTYDGVIGDPNEAVANVLIGTVAPAAGTVEVLSNGNALVLDASNSVVDTVTPPVVHDGNDTINTTLVARGDQLDAVLEQPVAAGSTATISIPVRAYPYDTTRAEFTYCLRHYFQCRAVRKLADQALASAGRRFPARTLEDGKGDAYRHCYGDGLVTRHYDESTAKGFGDRHEDHGPRPGETRAHAAGAKNMDLYNNAVGRMFGIRSGANTRTVFSDCLNAARAGNLRTIDPSGNIVTPGVYAVNP